MNAIILVGGLGTRLRPLTLTQPKALLPVLNKPFLTYQLDLLREAGIRHVMLAAGKIIRRWEPELEKCGGSGLKIHFAYEPSPLGTGGAVRFSYEALKKRRLLKPGPLLVFNGDIFFEFNVRKFISFHREKKSVASILLTKVKDPSRFGVVSTSPSGRIRRFIEKPKDASFGNLVNAGAYALEQDWIQQIAANQVVSIERDTFPQSVAQHVPMYGFKMGGYWNDIGTPDTYLKAHRDLLTVSNRWTSKTLFRKRGFLPERGVRGTPRIKGTAVVGHSSVIGKNVLFEGVVSCGRNVVVADDCLLRDCVLMDGVRVKRGAVIESSIVGRNCRIGEFSKIGAGSVLGDKTSLPAHTRC